MQKLRQSLARIKVITNGVFNPVGVAYYPPWLP